MAEGIDLKMRISGANKVQRELKQTGKAARGMGAGASAAGSAVAGLGAALNPVTAILAVAAAGLIAAAVAAKLTKDAFIGTIKATLKLSESLDEIGKKAKSIGGVSGEGLQVVIGAMELAGVEAGQTMKSLQKLNQSMGEGMLGTKSYTDAFDKLGISAEKMAALPLEKRLLAFSAGLEKLGTRAEQAQVGSLLMGRAFKDMIVGLENREALRGAMEDIRGYGVASNAAIKDSEELQDSILRMEKAFFGLKAEALAPLIPVFTGLAQATAEFLASLDHDKIKVFAHKVRDSVAEATGAFSELGLTAERALYVLGPVLDLAQATVQISMGRIGAAALNTKDALEGVLGLDDAFDRAEKRWSGLGAIVASGLDDAIAASLRGSEVPIKSAGFYTRAAGRAYRIGGKPADGGKPDGGKPPKRSGKRVDPLAGLKRELEAIRQGLRSKQEAMDEALAIQRESIRQGIENTLITEQQGMAQEIALAVAHDAKLLAMAETQAAAEKSIADRAAAERAALREAERLIRKADREAELAAVVQLQDAQRQAAFAVLGAVGSFAGNISNIITSLSDEQNEEAKKAAKVFFGIQQATALAGAIVNTALSISNALAVPPPPLGAALAVVAGASGAVQIAAISAATIQGIADAGLPPGALKQAGLSNHTMLAIRRDEMVLDPVGTAAISRMLEQRATGMGQPIVVQSTVEIDGEVLGRTMDNHLVRSSERGLGYQQRIRY